jgi:acyl dehydratase
MSITINGLDELRAAVGQEAVSNWHDVTQETVDTFAEASGDFNPLHVDPAVARESPFGGTITHGVWTLSLIPMFMESLWQLEGFDFAVLYGFNRVRFPVVLPVGSRVRMRLRVASVETDQPGTQVINELTFEQEGGEKPVCVAEHILRVYGGAGDSAPDG